jgi:hypothetical protein
VRDGVHVSGDGYTQIAGPLTQWPAWRAWFDG